MTPEAEARLLLMLDTASNDPRLSVEQRRDAERHVRNLRRLGRMLPDRDSDSR